MKRIVLFSSKQHKFVGSEYGKEFVKTIRVKVPNDYNHYKADQKYDGNPI